MGSETDIVVLFRRNEIGDISLVERLQRSSRGLVFTHLIEE